MRHSAKLFFLCVSMAGLYTYLFHGVGIGINLFVFEAIVAAAWWSMRRVPAFRLAILSVGGMILTAAMVLVHGSTLAIVVNLISVGLTVGVLLAPELNALHRSALASLIHLWAVPRALARTIPFLQGKIMRAGLSSAGLLKASIVPIVLLAFTGMYRLSNPQFNRFMSYMLAIFDHLDIALIGTFLVGLLASGFLFLSTRNEALSRWTSPRSDLLQAGPEAVDGQHLRGEVRIATVLLAGLNLLLLTANVLDIRYVWLDFKFDGQYLKQFVHEGTYMLLLSILLGAAIVLYYFRGDLNFHKENRVLKALSYAWLVQNMVLALSVGMRNYWYIHYYALAYKRIGVAFFLLALLIGLALVLLKVKQGRSVHFLLRTNTATMYCIVLSMSLFNWDGIIARYNMAQAGRAFVHLDFLATLSDKALPYLVQPQEKLELIAASNARLIGGAEGYSWTKYMTPEEYGAIMESRSDRFLETWPEHSWKEWNWAEDRAFHLLGPMRGAGQ